MAETSNNCLLAAAQGSFNGGMRRNIDPSKLEPNEYALGFNVRTRYGNAQPTKKHLYIDNTLIPAGNYQGCYGAGQYLVIFIDGIPYVKNYDEPQLSFAKVNGVQMAPDAETIWAELVPASTLNFNRVARTADRADTLIDLTTTINGSVQGLVIQDGTSQPCILFSDGSARRLQDYNGWNINNLNNGREYVPIGKQMLYYNGILYVVAADGKQIYRSVTGRPCDFMVIVDPNGDKLPSEIDGGAQAISHKVDFDEITLMARINTTVEVPGFLVTTAKNSYVVVPDTTYLLFAEPTFSTNYLFSTGALNNFCAAEVLGDVTFIDFTGIRSFNATTQYKVEGNNSPFSSAVFPFFGDIITQTSPAAISFDNYGLYAVNTIYGQGILAYDMLLEKFVSFDIDPNISAIKQFCEVKTTAGKRLLFFITADNRLYQAYGSTTTSNAAIYTREFSPEDSELEHTPRFLRGSFFDAKESGSISVTPFVDRKRTTGVTKQLTANLVSGQTPPIVPPWGQVDKSTTFDPTFQFISGSLRGSKVGYYIEWNFDVQLASFTSYSLPQKSTASIGTQAAIYERS